MQTQRLNHNYRPEIDGLRAIAVMSVIAYHADIPGVTGGFTGVDIFFVISGYLITEHLFSELGLTGSISLPSFYARRVKRLLPMLLLVVAVVLIFWGCFFLGIPEETNTLVKSIRFSMVGLPNVFFLNSVGNYFGQSAEEFTFLHFWSLGVEEQFYFIWPIMILICDRIARLKGVLFPRVAMLLLSVISIVSLFFSQYFLTHNHPLWSFYLVFTRFWELSVGALLVFIKIYRPNSIERTKHLQVLAYVGVFFLISSFFLYGKNTNFPGLKAILPVLGTALVIFIIDIFPNHPVQKILSLRPLVKIGVLSFGFYLWHWPILSLARLWQMGDSLSQISSISLILLSLFIAWVSFVFYERPLRSGLVRFSNWKTLFLLFLGVISIFGATSLLRKYEDLFLVPRWSKELSFISERAKIGSQCSAELKEVDVKHCSISFADKGSVKKSVIVMWGDSHAFADFPMVEEFAKNEKTDAILYSRNGLLGLSFPEIQYSQEVMASIQEQIQSHPNSNYSVILASRWLQHSGAQPISLPDSADYMDVGRTETGSLLKMADALDRTLSELTSIGVKKVLIVLPYPEFKFNVTRCLVRAKHFCSISRTEIERYRFKLISAFSPVVGKYSNVRTIDPVEILCNKNVCLEWVEDLGDSIPVVFDDDHASVRAIRKVGRESKDYLKWLILD